MQTFFFHVDYGDLWEDTEGTAYPGIAEARVAAVVFLAELLRDKGDAFWEKPSITLTVTDADGLVLYRLDAAGQESAAIKGAAHG